MSTSNTAQGQSVIEGFELSPQQARAWRWQGALLASSTRDAELGIRVPAEVDEARLQRSLTQLIERHEILRTQYQALPGMALPVQVVRLAGAADPEMTLSAPSNGGRLLRLSLPAVHVDTASLLRLAAEWAARYRGDTAKAAEPTLHYADYATWRHELTGSDPQGQELWERRLAGKGTGAALPLRGQAPATMAGVDFARLPLAVAPALHELWMRQARALDVQPAVLALAAWVTLFHQHGDVDEVTLGVDWQQRGPHLGDAFGLFSEALPLTAVRLGSSSVEALCKALSAACAELHEWRDYFPGAADERPYALGFRHVPSSLDDQAMLVSAGWEVLAIDSPTAPHHLLLEYRESSDGPRMTLHYDRTLYSDLAAALLGDQWLTLLERSCDDRTRKLGELSALSETERQVVTETLSRPPRLAPEREEQYSHIAGERHLMACFAEQSQKHPADPAVRDATGSLSYAELDARAARVAERLLARGATVGTRVAHFLRRDTDAIVTMLAILKVGAVYVPIDPDYPAARIAYILDDCGASLIATRRDLVTRLPERWQEEPRLVCMGESVGELVPCAWPEILSEHTAYVIYTSGTTGQPRGVPITHANALHSLAARVAYYDDPIRCFLLLSSFAFDSSIAGLFGTLAQGGCLRLCSETDQKDPGRLADILRDESVTHLLALPSLYQLLLQRLSGQPVALSTAIVAGEACPRALVEAHARTLTRTRLYNEYGATEASVWSTVAECNPSTDNRPVTIGRPIPGSRLHVLDENALPSARGLKGEMYVGGPGLSPGYLNRPELTAVKFVEIAGERLYRTGDFAYWDDRGELVFLGRADGQVKIRGYRVEVGEVEAALRRVTGVEHVVVLADEGDDGQLFLRGFVEDSRPLEVAVVRQALSLLLPEAMLPVDLQSLPQLPRTANGKLDRRALLALRRHRQRAPYSPPRGDAEITLARMWESLLATELIGRDDDFFVLGGHSLLAVRLVHAIKSELERDVPVSAVFQYPTLAGLAGRLAPGVTAPTQPGIAQSAPSSLVPLRAAGSRAPLFCVDPTGMHVTAYQPLADALADDQPVCGLDLGPALVSEGASVARIVERLTREIRQHQPRGPYRILGWSLGGVLALGVARALEAQGESVAFLGILDTQPPTRLYAAGLPDLVQELAEYVNPDRRAELLALPPLELSALRERLERLRADERSIEAITWAQARGYLPDDTPPAALVHRYELLRDAAGFMNRLPPRCLEVAIHAWWSTQTLERAGGTPMDWKQYTRAEVHTSVVLGDHFAAVQSPVIHSHLHRILSALPDAADAATRALTEIK